MGKDLTVMRVFGRHWGIWHLSITEIKHTFGYSRLVVGVADGQPHTLLIRSFTNLEGRGEAQAMWMAGGGWGGLHEDVLKTLQPGDAYGNYTQMFGVDPMPPVPGEWSVNWTGNAPPAPPLAGAVTEGDPEMDPTLSSDLTDLLSTLGFD